MGKGGHSLPEFLISHPTLLISTLTESLDFDSSEDVPLNLCIKSSSPASAALPQRHHQHRIWSPASALEEEQERLGLLLAAGGSSGSENSHHHHHHSHPHSPVSVSSSTEISNRRRAGLYSSRKEFTAHFSSSASQSPHSERTFQVRPRFWKVI